MSHESALSALQQSIKSLRRDQLTIDEFCGLWRTQSTLLADLPNRYSAVMEDLLLRLEAGSLFTEESCSFSQIDLLANLDIWLDQASKTLATH